MADMKCKMIGPGCPADGSSLGYAPNVAASIIFMSIFSLSLIGHLILGWKYKTWTFMAAMFLGSSSEVVGYLGRILMHNNPYNLSTSVFAIPRFPPPFGSDTQTGSSSKSSVLQQHPLSTPQASTSAYHECALPPLPTRTDEC
jgi:hypothetical protein